MKKLLLAFFLVLGFSSSMMAKDFYHFDKSGNLVRPVNYRSWVYVGTPLTPNDQNKGKAAFQEFHNVYIDPVSYDFYKKTGKFKDGTILVKELVSVGSKAAVSGNGYFMGDFIGLEATIKDKKAFPNEPGNWGYFSFSNPKTGDLTKTAKKFPANACNSCHEGSAQDDFVFTQYYPVLRAAKGFGSHNPENIAKRSLPNTASNASASKKVLYVRLSTDTFNIPLQTSKEKLWEASTNTPNATLIKTNKKAVFAYLKSGKYKKFKTQEKSLHKSNSFGAHEYVRTFLNDTLANSLKNGNVAHPKGSLVVKELYSNDKKLVGWALMLKTNKNSDQGKGWFWYEILNTNNPDKIAAHGNGVPGCTSCHSGGNDMLLIPFPLEY